jgi:cytochrome c peroxidase
MHDSGYARTALIAASSSLAVLLATGCSGGEDVARAPTLVERGEALFTQETFDGNGRVCSTCHEPDQFGTITPEYVQARHAVDPTDPLFRAIDSDDGLGESYERLLTHATVRVPMPLERDPATGLSVRLCDAPQEVEVFVHRGNPTVFNVVLEDLLMVDGRDGGDLETQAHNAVRTHNEPGREATPDELAAIAAYQRSLFSHAAVRDFLERGGDLELPQGVTPEERRGRTFFEPQRPCGVCHSGPMLNRTSPLHDAVVGSRYETVLVGAEPDNPNPKREWCWVDPETSEIVPGPDGSERVFPAPVADPGAVILPGSLVATSPDGSVDTIPNSLLGQLAGPLFKIPSLWGVPNTAPYFHDNSAKTLDDVLDQYNFMFSNFTDFARHVGCDPDAGDCIAERDRADIIAFLQLLAFEELGHRALASGG